MPRRAWAYIGAIFFFGLGLTIWSLINMPDNIFAEQWSKLAILALLATLAQLFKAEAPDHQIYHTTLVFQFAGVIILDPFLFVFLILIPHLVEWGRERLIIVDSPHLRDWYLQPFNIALHIVVGFASRSVYLGLNELSTVLGSAAIPLAVVVSASIYTVLNHLLVGLAITFARGISLRESGIMDLSNLITDLVTLLIGYSVAAL
jgi:hypothetical protein